MLAGRAELQLLAATGLLLTSQKAARLLAQGQLALQPGIFKQPYSWRLVFVLPYAHRDAAMASALLIASSSGCQKCPIYYAVRKYHRGDYSQFFAMHAWQAS